MSYDVEINKRTVTYRDDRGRWLEGNSVELSSEPTEVESFDPMDDPWDTPHLWAVHLISTTDVNEASSWPIGGVVSEWEWLSGSYTDPYTGNETETTVRLTGDWDEYQRAAVFNAVV